MPKPNKEMTTRVRLQARALFELGKYTQEEICEMIKKDGGSLTRKTLAKWVNEDVNDIWKTNKIIIEPNYKAKYVKQKKEIADVKKTKEDNKKTIDSEVVNQKILHAQDNMLDAMNAENDATIIKANIAKRIYTEIADRVLNGLDEALSKCTYRDGSFVKEFRPKDFKDAVEAIKIMLEITGDLQQQNTFNIQQNNQLNVNNSNQSSGYKFIEPEPINITHEIQSEVNDHISNIISG